MKLSDLIKIHPEQEISYDPDITSIASHTKDVEPGGLFIAVRGYEADGHDYIDLAFKKGALAVIAQANPENREHIFLVDNSRLSMASIAARFYGNPSEKLTIAGITGTNGKTTTSWLLESIFKTAGLSCGVIGTVNIRYNHKTFDNPITTPDSIDLQKTLYNMEKAGVTHVIMEVSSHGLALNRVDFCQFDAGVFTNLSQDHLDYHKDMDRYFNCKKSFFINFIGQDKKKNGIAVLNMDDPRGNDLLKTLDCRTIAVSTKEKTDIFAEDIKDTIHGLSGTICMPKGSFKFSSLLTGTFNLENILCASGAAHALNIRQNHIRKGIENCHVIPGRLEKINTPIDRFLFVDYAHTPDALESILTSLKQRAPKRIIIVFGCGGDRDRSKRPLMGQIVCEQSDIAIVTSDNPRSEHPDSIINDILEGMDSFTELSDKDLRTDPFKKGFLIEVDRRKALKKAVFISKPEDIIIAAGKGHETYQITNTGIIHFDDREELKLAATQFHDQFNPITWNISDISAAIECDPVFSNLLPDHSFTKISTDSRITLPSQIFLALKGETFDGHSYIHNLVEKGVKGFITRKGFYKNLDDPAKNYLQQKGLVFFETSDTLAALGKLARYQRIRSKVKVVAITGSSGKTTTRKIIHEIFKTQFHTHATRKNFNNEIGLPLTLLDLSYAHEWAIVEMGMNHPGEISRLGRIAEPDIAIILNTADVHLEGLGSVKNVAKAKAEIFESMAPGSTAILFSDDPRRKILEDMANKNPDIEKLIFFGSKKDADVQSSRIKNSGSTIEFTAKIKNDNIKLSINSPARFMIDNSLAAVCAAMTAGICRNGIKKGILAFTPEPGRMNIYRLCNTINIIDDTYNANPASVTGAIQTLAHISRGQNNIAVLGDMLELGEQSDFFHQQTGKKTAESKISRLYIFGSQGQHTIDSAIKNGFSPDHIFHGTKKQIAEKIFTTADPDTWVLVKGSRGMAMETVIQELKQLLIGHSQEFK